MTELAQMLIDEKDRKIIDELSNDARIPTKRIATNLDIPRVTVHTRIEKMKEEGVIKRFTVQLDYEKIGLPVTAFVFVVFSSDIKVPIRELAEKIAAIENVFEVHLISGEWDILVKIRGKSLDEIGKIVLDKIRTLDGVSKTITCPSFQNIKNGL